jgi:HTH-type transcriptional regulator / antitoxin HipB
MARVRTPRDVGALIRSAREDRNWTLVDLAERAGVSRRWLIQVEHGHPRAELSRVLQVLQALDIKLDARIPSVGASAPSRMLMRDPLRDKAKTGAKASPKVAASSVDQNAERRSLDLERHLASFDERR